MKKLICFFIGHDPENGSCKRCETKLGFPDYIYNLPMLEKKAVFENLESTWPKTGRNQPNVDNTTEPPKRGDNNNHIKKDIITDLKKLSRYDCGAWPDGCPAADSDSEGDWIMFIDIETIIKKYSSEPKQSKPRPKPRPTQP